MIVQTISDPVCPLCHTRNSHPFHEDGQRAYLQCRTCDLIHVPSRHRLSREDEKAQYDFHENDPDDPRYRAFLNALFEPMRDRLSPGARGIDFGAGPGPALAAMFREAGFPMAIYDPFYAADRDVLNRTYDFLTCTETAEHFFDPYTEWQRFRQLVRPGGLIGVMTRFRLSDHSFADWRYKDDPTHVCFYSPETFEWIGRRYGMAVTLIGDSVAIFER